MATLVAAVDFSKPSRKAFDAAVHLARDLGADLVLVHALPRAPKKGPRDPIGQVKAEIAAGEWQQLIKDWAVRAQKDVTVHTVARAGKPADVVAAAVKRHKATLVVVGSHGAGLRRAILGSVAEAIVRSSKVPVVVVPK